MSEVFEPKNYDFRIGYKGYFSYSEILPENFENFEKELYASGFIDKDYNFINKKGRKTELAAIFYALIHSNNRIFAKTSYKIHRDYKELEYRKYLDHRYNVNPNTKQLYNLVRRDFGKVFIVMGRYIEIYKTLPFSFHPSCLWDNHNSQ